MTPTPLSDLRRLLEAAPSDDDWCIEHDDDEQVCIYAGPDVWVARLPHQCVESIRQEQEARAALIVAAVNALPGLLDEVEKAARAVCAAHDRIAFGEQWTTYDQAEVQCGCPECAPYRALLTPGALP